jgi:hypothetical protein
MQNSTFNVEASKVIHGIVTFSPAPESVSLEFLNELGQVDGLEQLGNINSLTNWNACLTIINSPTDREAPDRNR